MEADKDTFHRILQLITYRRKEDQSFYFPETQATDEEDEIQQNKRQDEGSGRKVQVVTDDRSGKSSSGKADTKEKSDEEYNAGVRKVSKDIRTNINMLEKTFNAPDNKDFVIHQFVVAGEHKAFLAFLDGMVDRLIINSFILRPLLSIEKFEKESKDSCTLDYIKSNILEINQINEIDDADKAVYEILMGNTLLYIDGCSYYITNETKGFDKRSVEKPQTEGVVQGPQEAFNENLRTNTTLIRRILKNSKLTTEFFKVGKQSKTLCAVMYIKGLTNPALVDEVKRRIQGVKTDFFASAGMLEQLIDERPMSIFPTMLSTERPDRTTSHLVEGKVAILLDGSPFSIIAPITLHSLVHTPEDSALRWQYGTFIRFIRLFAIFLATLLPALYVAATNFHQEMIPTELLIAIAKAKENVPFPTIVEVILMEVSFELIREAGIRIPGIIGNTLGIIGALILGQAAVQANIVSPVLIIIVAITGLGNFAIPNFNLAFGVRLLRFIFIISGAILGFFGITVAFVIVAAMALGINSFGVPYFMPIAPKTRKSYDIFIRWPLWMQELRPDGANALNDRRQPHISRQWMRKGSGAGKGHEDE